jgi:hypothetical protein
MRVWRALKSSGCGVLRDGVYLLPESGGARQALEKQADEVIEAGGMAYVLRVTTDDQQTGLFRNLFQRDEDYRRLMNEIRAFVISLPRQELVSARRTLAKLRRDLEQIVSLDFFPGLAREQAESTLADADTAYAAAFTPDEPSPEARPITELDKAEYQSRVWATRKHPWVDRLASAWLIKRFIDRDARFLWLEKPRDCPRTAIGFDFSGAAFTHVGQRVTFEVLLASFSLEGDPGLKKLAASVHYLDVGGAPAPEAAGFEAILAGARKSCRSDDALLAESIKIFDLLYSAYAESPRTRTGTEWKK